MNKGQQPLQHGPFVGEYWRQLGECWRQLLLEAVGGSSKTCGTAELGTAGVFDETFPRPEQTQLLTDR